MSEVLQIKDLNFGDDFWWKHRVYMRVRGKMFSDTDDKGYITNVDTGQVFPVNLETTVVRT